MMRAVPMMAAVASTVAVKLDVFMISPIAGDTCSVYKLF